MQSATPEYDRIQRAFESSGLALRGGLSAKDGWDLPMIDGGPARCLLLVGNLGRDMWPHYIAAARARRKASDAKLSLDKWTQDVTEPLAAKFDATAVYVFEGPPFHPFQRWAQAAEGLGVAPNNMLIHPRYGIWQAYRAALLFAREISIPRQPDATHPCEECAGKPCISACPVDAITDKGFDFDRCAGYFRANRQTACLDGCAARLACPIGKEHAYPLEQRQFHMHQFVARHASGHAAETSG